MIEPNQFTNENESDNQNHNNTFASKVVCWETPTECDDQCETKVNSITISVIAILFVLFSSNNQSRKRKKIFFLFKIRGKGLEENMFLSFPVSPSSFILSLRILLFLFIHISWNVSLFSELVLLNNAFFWFLFFFIRGKGVILVDGRTFL